MRQWNRPGNTVCIRWRTHYPGRFRGTYYRAANWKLFGRTTGRGKASNSYEPNRPIKEALGFEMERLRCNGCRAVVHRGGT